MTAPVVPPPPMRATKYVDWDAFAQLGQIVSDLISEIGDSPDIPPPPRREAVVHLRAGTRGSRPFSVTGRDSALRMELPRPASEAIRPKFSSSEPRPGVPRFWPDPSCNLSSNATGRPRTPADRLSMTILLSPSRQTDPGGVTSGEPAFNSQVGSHPGSHPDGQLSRHLDGDGHLARSSPRSRTGL